MLLHQSDLSSWNRCPAAFGYSRFRPGKQNSASAYGSVMHHSLQVYQRRRVDVGHDAAVQDMLQTFAHYWNPFNIAAICDPVPADGWLPRRGYSELRAKGLNALREYTSALKFDDQELLATEYSFLVPIEGTWDDDLGEPHMLAGSIDRLAVRHYKRRETLCVDDFKSGKEYRYLRQNLQFTAYCMATMHPLFWTGNQGEEGFGPERGAQLHQRFADKARRGTWINLNTIKAQDAGFRGPKDYRRFAIAVEQIAASIKADIFPMTLAGDVCTFCEHRDYCAGVGVPKDDHGDPTRSQT